MLKFFDICARVVMVVVTVLVLVRVSAFFSPRPIDRYVHGGLIGAEQTETLFTGFATVPVLYFTKGRTLSRFDPYRDDGGIPNKPDGFCYRLYDLAIGYKSLHDTLSLGAGKSDGTITILPEPQVLAANVVEARHGGAVHRYDCDATEFAPTQQQRTARLEFFKTVLQGNRQWETHRRNAHAILTSLDDRLRQSQLEARESRTMQKTSAAHRPSDVKTAGFSIGVLSLAQSGSGFNAGSEQMLSDDAFALNGGALGSLKLTFSTIALFTRDKNWFFQKNEFYVRQDNAEVTYGVDFYHEFHARPALFGPRNVTIRLPEPRVLSTDRYSLALAAHPQKFNPAGKKKSKATSGEENAPQDTIEKAITDELQRQIDRIEKNAIATSKGLIADQVQSLMRAHGSNVVVHFERAQTLSALDLLRQTNTQGEEYR